MTTEPTTPAPAIAEGEPREAYWDVEGRLVLPAGTVLFVCGQLMPVRVPAKERRRG